MLVGAADIAAVGVQLHGVGHRHRHEGEVQRQAGGLLAAVAAGGPHAEIAGDGLCLAVGVLKAGGENPFPTCRAGCFLRGAAANALCRIYVGDRAPVSGGFHGAARRRMEHKVGGRALFAQIHRLGGEGRRVLPAETVIVPAEAVTERDGIFRFGGHCDLDRDLLVDQLEVPVPARIEREPRAAVPRFERCLADRRFGLCRAVCQLGKVYSAFGVLVGRSAGANLYHRQSGRRLRRDRQQLRAQAQA